MSWNIILFESNRGEKPVEEFIKSLDKLTGPKINHHVRLLMKFGPILSMPSSKKITKNLYELRIRGKQEIRILYCFKNRNIYFIHAFKKQTQKTPRREIEIGIKRLDMI